jgi:hypothetical protein
MLQTMEERSLISYRICNLFAQSAPASYPKLSDPVPKIPQMQHGLMELDSSRYRNKRISLFDWISFACSCRHRIPRYSMHCISYYVYSILPSEC